MSGDTTRAPPRAPRRTLIKDSASRIRNASRSVGRDTPNISISTVSDGSESPVFRSPRTICPRIYDAISSAVLGARRTCPAGSRFESTGARPHPKESSSSPSLPELPGGTWASGPRRWPGSAPCSSRDSGRGPGGRLAETPGPLWLGRVLVLEGQPQLGPEDDLAAVLDGQVLLHHLGDAQVPQ